MRRGDSCRCRRRRRRAPRASAPRGVRARRESDASCPSASPHPRSSVWESCSLDLRAHWATLRACPSGSRLELETIPDAGLGEYVPGLRRIRLELLPQMRDVDADVVAALDEAWTPDLAQQMPMREHLPRVRDQHGQQPILDRRQMLDGARFAYDAIRLVDLDVVEAEHRVLVARAHRLAAPHRTYASEELAHAERLRKVIVSA